MMNSETEEVTDVAFLDAAVTIIMAAFIHGHSSEQTMLQKNCFQKY